MGIGIKTVFQGRLVKDPELRTTRDGTEVCNFAVAVDRGFQKDKSSWMTDFVDCVAWRGLGAFVAKYFQKGKGIVAEGRWEQEKWVDNDGRNRTTWKVAVDNVEFALGSRGDAAAPVMEELGVDDGDLPF